MKKLEAATGSCKVCDINLYGAEKRPKIFPCGIKGCPYETAEEQAKIAPIDFSTIGNGLGQID